jgi:AraC family transcriptional regulator of arabinose operon
MDWRVRFTMDLMRRDLGRPLPIAVLARRIHLSPSRFAHLFQRDTGHSPARYLRELRLDRARALAEESVLSIKEIMVRVGFNDASHFTRDFTRRHGAPPRTIRARAHSPGLSGGRLWWRSTIRQRTAESAKDRAVRTALVEPMLDQPTRNIA